MQEKVINYYENYDEEGRLFRDNAHMVEYLTSIHYFDKLFSPNSHILDACAGTGRYSFYLSKKGHTVTACDLVEHNVNIIKSNPEASRLNDIKICNVLNLSEFEESSFDVVLCMGALYHLQDNKERQKAVSECVRVCKAKGIVVLSYIIDSEKPPDLSPDENVFFSITPCEINKFAKTNRLDTIHNILTDGVINIIGSDKLNEANDEEFRKYMESYYLICEEPRVIMTGGHGLYIGRLL